MTRTHGIIAGVVLSILFFGCDTGRSTYPAGGIVKYTDGGDIKQLEGGLVQFDCKEAKTSARGVIQSDGSFTLNTFKKDGAVLGEHRAMVLPPPRDGISDNPPANVVNRKYLSFRESGLVFEVTTDPEKNHFVLEVQQP